MATTDILIGEVMGKHLGSRCQSHHIGSNDDGALNASIRLLCRYADLRPDRIIALFRQLDSPSASADDTQRVYIDLTADFQALGLMNRFIVNG